MQKDYQENTRLQKVLKKAKQQSKIKDMSTFAFANLFSTLLVLLAPFFSSKQTQGK